MSKFLNYFDSVINGSKDILKGDPTWNKGRWYFGAFTFGMGLITLNMLLATAGVVILFTAINIHRGDE